MPNIHRTLRTPGTPMTPADKNGEEGVAGSSPAEASRKTLLPPGRVLASVAATGGRHEKADARRASPCAAPAGGLGHASGTGDDWSGLA